MNWLWTVKDYLSFDFGGRVDGLGQHVVRYESDEQFSPLARQLAMAAAEQACGYRELFPSVEACARELARANERNLNHSLNAGVALGLIGDASSAREMLPGICPGSSRTRVSSGGQTTTKRNTSECKS